MLVQIAAQHDAGSHRPQCHKALTTLACPINKSSGHYLQMTCHCARVVRRRVPKCTEYRVPLTPAISTASSVQALHTYLRMFACDSMSTMTTPSTFPVRLKFFLFRGGSIPDTCPRVQTVSPSARRMENMVRDLSLSFSPVSAAGDPVLWAWGDQIPFSSMKRKSGYNKQGSGICGH